MNKAAPLTFRIRLSAHQRAALRLGIALLIPLGVLSTCSPKRTALQEVEALGVLRVATVNSPTTYYLDAGGDPTGFEYELAKGLADRLGVQIELTVAESPPQAIEQVRDGRVHLAAAGLGVSPGRSEQVRFSPRLLQVVPLLVYRQGQPRPRNLGELQGRLGVVKDGVHAERLRTLAEHYPGLQWDESQDLEAEDLLFKVANGELEYTIANSDLVAINQRYYPKLRVAFTVAESQDIAWALPKNNDDSLYTVVAEYLNTIGDDELARIKDRHFGHIRQVDAYGALTLATHVETRLPRYREAFESASQKTGIDWRLLAAIGYQESHWDPNAVSPTGVRGIMQLTNATAAFLNVANREDPIQSIHGGSRYFAQLLAQLPPEIAEPDRTWMALAGYNMGMGHLYDARRLTIERGGDPNRWLDVRKTLPLLSQSKWYSKTRNGYARGQQAVIYVGNVRTYYDMLAWITGGPAPSPESAAEGDATPPDPDPRRDPLDIDTPML